MYLDPNFCSMKLQTIFLTVISFIFCTAIYSQGITPPPDTLIVNDSGIFERVEEEASYPGGVNAWRDFLAKNLNPNTPVENSAPAGQYTVIVQFVVSKDGTVSDIKALTKHGYGMEQEVIRVLRKTGAWTPARQNNRPVNAFRKQPVTFMVTMDGLDIITQTPYTLFTNINNEITVDAGKLKSEDMRLTISQGTVVPKGNKHFTVKVKNPGRAIITVYGKRDKEIGQMSFEVRAR
jgi:hypothetical protein